MARKITSKRKVKKSVLIAFEDSKSSKYYFNDLLRDKNLKGQIELVNKDKGQDPNSVLNKILEYKEQPSDSFIRKWIVIDKDNWDAPPKYNYSKTIEKAKKLNICVAFSNDAYELWIYLHFKPLNRNTHRKKLISMLNKIFKDEFGKEYEKSSSDIYRLIKGYQSNAIINAKKLVNQHLSNYGKINPKENPITMIFELVEYLNQIDEFDKKDTLFFPQRTDYEVYKFSK